MSLGSWLRRFLRAGFRQRWGRLAIAFFMALSLAVVPTRVYSAESLILDLGPLGRSIETDALVRFAETGEIDSSLEPYLRQLSPERKTELRGALTANQEVDLVHWTNWLYTPMGERSLLFLGNIVTTGSRFNGQQALRAALIGAAAEDGAISVLDVIRHFPTSLRIDLNVLLQVAQQAIAEAQQTLAFQEAIAAASAEEARQNPIDLETLPNLLELGPYPVQQVSLTLTDSSRDRTFPVALYSPENLTTVDHSLPVVVISHGLGDTRSNFSDLATHMASYGFVVAAPDHIGSNSTQKEAMFRGLESETFRAREFLDRPLDVTFLLDTLEKDNASRYQGKLDVENVAVLGHSFGGYTALALAGATVDFEQLQRECTPEFNLLLDAAKLLECRALELTADPAVVEQLGTAGVQDRRVKLVMGAAPVSHLFGAEGMGRINIPVIIAGGAFDIIAPVVPQQLKAFHSLKTPERYLYLWENTSHTADLTRLINRALYLNSDFEQGIEEGVVLNRALTKALSAAFAKVYLAREEAYHPFLTAAYVEAVSETPFKRRLVRELPESVVEGLSAIEEGFF